MGYSCVCRTGTVRRGVSIFGVLVLVLYPTAAIAAFVGSSCVLRMSSVKTFCDRPPRDLRILYNLIIGSSKSLFVGENAQGTLPHGSSASNLAAGCQRHWGRHMVPPLACRNQPTPKRVHSSTHALLDTGLTRSLRTQMSAFFSPTHDYHKRLGCSPGFRSRSGGLGQRCEGGPSVRKFVTTHSCGGQRGDTSGTTVGRGGRKKASTDGETSLVGKVAMDLRHRCGVGPGSRLVVAVSGGSDSVALLHILVAIRDLWGQGVDADRGKGAVAVRDAVDGGQPQGGDVAVSGGEGRVDEREQCLDIHVVHFNHGLREESVEEETFVTELARQLKVQIQVVSLDAERAESFRRDPSGMQEFARNWRRSEMARIALDGAGAYGASRSNSAATHAHSAPAPTYLVTAHHADDQVETMLMKMLRGVHVTNLQGMAWADSRVPPLVRPLLGVSKDDLVAYLTER
jgi:hypothetical protein